MNALKQLRSSTGTFELISYLSIEGSKLREVKKTILKLPLSGVLQFLEGRFWGFITDRMHLEVLHMHPGVMFENIKGHHDTKY